MRYMVDREEIGKRVRELFPELWPWFKFCYGTPAALTCQGRRLPFDSREGVQQGDPLAPLFFALGILKMGQRIKGEISTGVSLWYLDDGSIMGDGSELMKAWKIVQEEAKKIGMRLNESKCEIWAWEGAEEEWMNSFPKEVKRMRENGFELLGAPIGDKTFSEKYAKARVAKIKEVLDRLDILDDPQVEMALLRSCIGFPRFGFTLRSAPPDKIEEAAQEFDAMMREVAEKRFKIALTKDRERQWHLPIRMGGIGIPKAEDVMAPAYLANSMDALPFVQEMIKGVESLDDIAGAREAWARMRDVLQEEDGEIEPEFEEAIKEWGIDIPEENIETFLEDLEEAGNAIPESEGGKKQHFLHSLIQLKRLKQWLQSEEKDGDEERSEEERNEQRRDMLRKLLVMRGDKAVGYAGDWLNVVPCEALGTKMARPVFLVALMWWLGAKMWQAEKCEQRTLQGRKCESKLDQWGDHAVSCKVGPGVIARHNTVNVVWMLAEKAAGFGVQREQRVQFGSRKKPADTLVWGWKGKEACAQDWAVVHPMTKCGLKTKKMDPFGAVTKAEERKRRLEAGMCESAGVDFMPLAMDTFGGFGPSAAEAIEIVADQMRTLKGEEESEKEFKAKRLAQKLRVVVLRFVARQILSRTDVGRLEEKSEECEKEFEWKEEEIGPKEDLADETDSCSDQEKGDNERTVDINKLQKNKDTRRKHGTDGGKRQSSRRKHSRSEKTPGTRKTSGKRKTDTVLGWNEWKKDKGLIGKDKWNLEWYHEAGLKVVEAGQGRGGECQYLSALVMADPESWEWDSKRERIVVKEEKVDAVRRAVADWLAKHRKDRFQSGLSVQQMALAEWKGGGKDENEKWQRYLAGVRNWRRGQWGDDCTLMGLSGVLGRPIYALSCGRDKKVRPYNVSAPFTWGEKIEGAPLLLAHVSDLHYCQVQSLRAANGTLYWRRRKTEKTHREGRAVSLWRTRDWWCKEDPSADRKGSTAARNNPPISTAVRTILEAQERRLVWIGAGRRKRPGLAPPCVPALAHQPSGRRERPHLMTKGMRLRKRQRPARRLLRNAIILLTSDLRDQL